MTASIAPVLAIFNLGPTELVVILLILVLLFGGTKLPGLAKGIGQSIREFKKASKENAEEEQKSADTKAALAKPADPANTHGNN